MAQMFDRLRIEVARHIGIDPDRIRIKAGEPYCYTITVEGPIPRAAEQELRQYVNDKTPAHIQWTVRASVSD